MSELKNEVRRICEARMEQVQISSRERDLIEHIKVLQAVLGLLKKHAPEQIENLIDQHIELSKDIVIITLGLRS